MEKLTIKLLGDYFLGLQVEQTKKSGSIIIATDASKEAELFVYRVVAIGQVGKTMGIEPGDHVVCTPRGSMTVPVSITMNGNVAEVAVDAQRLKLIRVSNITAVYCANGSELSLPPENGEAEKYVIPTWTSDTKVING